MGHFLVIAALERVLAPWRWLRWLVLAAVAVLVHPYLGVMVCVLGLGAAAARAEGAVATGRAGARRP